MVGIHESWLLFALGSALFAALTAILSKIGVEGVNSNVATMIRTTVVLLFASVLVFRKFSPTQVFQLSSKTFLFLTLSGLATGASWLCYNRALQLGPVSKVAPVDKLSVVFVIVLSVFALGEPVNSKTIIGACLIAAGAVVLAL